MDRSLATTEAKSNEDAKEQRIQENIAKWQSDNTLAKLSEAQLDILYQVQDLIEEQNVAWIVKTSDEDEGDAVQESTIPIITTNQDYVKWMVRAENEMKSENISEYLAFYEKLKAQSTASEVLYRDTEESINAVECLRKEYKDVTDKTDSLHNLSEQLMKNQKQYKDKSVQIKERLHYFRLFNTLSDNIDRFNSIMNDEVFLDTLDKIDECRNFFETHSNYKEANTYSRKYEHVLTKAVIVIRRYFNDIVVSVSKQVVAPDSKANILSSNESTSGDMAFSLYYGKFRNASIKVKDIISHVEAKSDKDSTYKQLLIDCQQIYLNERANIMSDPVSKSLLELRQKQKTDYSVLFRSAGLFIMQVCLDEVACYNYFFTGCSQQLEDYLGVLCQSLYDMLRPCLISIYHLEILTELCNILRKEMLNEQIISNEHLDKFSEIVKQLLEDIEERLVFRTHIFLQNDVMRYNPSPGDLAYPEKLKQMEHITEEIMEIRSDSRASVISVESREVANINSSVLNQFRSYTGNSPADLHGMWYPTVKRTLVCLSRLYFCLDREIFQGLAQEALTVCADTISKAEKLITAKKSSIDGHLFQIKHLLILREQIAPFQVDFTVKEVSLDFSNLQAAAAGLIQNRGRLFTFGTNNALLEFLLEGTPKVKEYLLDSRKEIDKQLKVSCEQFITYATSTLVGNVVHWISIAGVDAIKVTLPHQEFGKPQFIAAILGTAQRNIKLKIPEIQRSMQLYLANRETEFILFRPIKNGIINAFIQVEQILTNAKYSSEDRLMIACPSAEQVNLLICSVSLAAEQDHHFGIRSRSVSTSSAPLVRRESSVENTLPSFKQENLETQNNLETKDASE